MKLHRSTEFGNRAIYRRGSGVGCYYWHCSVTAILDGQIAVEKISWLGKMSNDDICGCGSVHIFAEPLGK